MIIISIIRANVEGLKDLSLLVRSIGRAPTWFYLHVRNSSHEGALGDQEATQALKKAYFHELLAQGMLRTQAQKGVCM